MDLEDYNRQFLYYCKNICTVCLARVRAINYYSNGVMNH